jgi:hypothetical protein
MQLCPLLGTLQRSCAFCIFAKVCIFAKAEDAMSGKPPRVIDVEEEDIKSDIEEDQEREDDPAPIDKLGEGDVIDEDEEVVEVEKEEE